MFGTWLFLSDKRISFKRIPVLKTRTKEILLNFLFPEIIRKIDRIINYLFMDFFFFGNKLHFTLFIVLSVKQHVLSVFFFAKTYAFTICYIARLCTMTMFTFVSNIYFPLRVI